MLIATTLPAPPASSTALLERDLAGTPDPFLLVIFTYHSNLACRDLLFPRLSKPVVYNPLLQCHLLRRAAPARNPAALCRRTRAMTTRTMTAVGAALAETFVSSGIESPKAYS